MARPTELTDDVQKRIVEAIEVGNYYEAACQRAGISYQTFLRWMKWGESGRESRARFHAFRQAVVAAEGRAEVRIVEQWQQQIPENWQAARDFLARRFPDRWGPKERVEHTGKNGEPIEVTIDLGSFDRVG